MKITMNSSFWARALIAVLFVFAGVGKVMNYDLFQQGLETKFGSLAMILAALVVVIEIPVAIAYAVGYKLRWAAYVLLGYIALVTIFYHNPMATGVFDPNMMVAALKNVAIMAGVWATILCSCNMCDPTGMKTA